MSAKLWFSFVVGKTLVKKLARKVRHAGALCVCLGGPGK